MEIIYEIKTTEIKPFTYRAPLIAPDDNGELSVRYSRHQAKHIKKVVLLNLVGRNKKGDIVSYAPLEQVNRFLLAHHLDDNKQESEQYSKGLVHYFSFLIELQRLWDSEFNENLYDESVDLPRPCWDKFPVRKSDKATYQYREALKRAVLRPQNPNQAIARTTATAYMGAVVKFYSFHIRNGYKFNNPPFEHEVVSIHYQGDSKSISSYLSKDVHTTDLRLNFGKSKRSEGGALSSSRRDLKPLTNKEWLAVEGVLTGTRRVIKTITGETTTSSLSIEYCLFFLVARYTGLRKEEVASLHKGQVVKPDEKKKAMRFGVGDHYGSLTKTAGRGNKSRQTIIPTRIMQLLYEYIRSDRYKNRISKFKERCELKRQQGVLGYFDGEDGVDDSKDYLFISQTGVPFFTKLSEANARWNELRATINVSSGLNLIGTVHNLRATFAVSLFRLLLRHVTPDKALALVNECLGHGEESVTLKYLKIAQDEPTGDEIYEDILEFIGAFEEADLGGMENQ
ncbi:tyrosine-type recombinase/integrase [Alteromonas sp. 1_MG-2023]|uniref:tyrosine-type recombinase/integrase n=1 Tax=Alteromonas sp. 1_MG-2023 TaxID=3062669 RepID=UPI0026E241E6|nr:tyrosine-type recombinase/integrase [Alteromonas sp. 1_MG-2023]MDO6475539.1 tyrosine-type recombinase/integrase [Alteromonas sp. 1_MG-2023]